MFYIPYLGVQKFSDMLFFLQSFQKIGIKTGYAFLLA